MHFICLLPSFGITQEKDNERVMHIYGGYSLHAPDAGITILKIIQKSEENLNVYSLTIKLSYKLLFHFIPWQITLAITIE